MNEKNKRNKWLHVRLNQKEYDQLDKQFKATTCRKISDFVRKKLLGRLLVGSYRNASLDGYLEELSVLKSDLHAVANNFNQAVKKLHTLDKIKDFEHWLITYELDKRSLLKQVEQIAEHIKKASEKW